MTGLTTMTRIMKAQIDWIALAHSAERCGARTGEMRPVIQVPGSPHVNH